MADRIGSVSVCIANGSRKVECILEVTKIAEDRDIIIGLPQFEAFGYRIEGVPIKKPENFISFAEEVEVIPENVDVQTSPRDISKEVEVLVEENRSIALSVRCLDPLAVLSLRQTISEFIWKNTNYVSAKDARR